ncbi:hypothetical protein PZB75_26500 [Streptomyces sp. AM 4-1-1]|uniref:hypothetical protein n=1 Tax=Streptomyces sp. AM 4-1-1 TaxID=3028710 RepID=UPI0023B8DC2B|nr:hypothetical protein [Streptomyces sp. AM 4-1-1]WEH36590.1 hypothetical protein PZB75_26500 [Streptomyces sp. AM 4-1-1]
MYSDTVSREELAEIVRTLPVHVWNSPSAAEVYGRTLNIVCRTRRSSTAGVWVCPLDEDDGGPAARRAYRLLPYVSPWTDPALHPVDRHRTVVSMAAAVMERVYSIDLPMDPRFSEVAALAELGAEVRCRHTRLLALDGAKEPRQSYVPTARNHIRAAARRHSVAGVPPEDFDFSRAIVGQSDAAVAERRRAGLRLSRDHPCLCLAALDQGGVCRGQVFVLECDDAAVLMHSWFDREGARGVPSLLVDAAVEAAVRDPGISTFDFEGSVIPSIDHFMTGFGARACAYPHLRWRRAGGRPDVAEEFG